RTTKVRLEKSWYKVCQAGRSSSRRRRNEMTAESPAFELWTDPEFLRLSNKSASPKGATTGAAWLRQLAWCTRDRYATGLGDFTVTRQRVLTLRFRSLGERLASEVGARRSGSHQICR